MISLSEHIPDNVEEVLFDWNGTLLDDVEYCISVTNRFLEENQLPMLTLSRYRQIFQFPVQDYYKKLGFSFEDESFSEKAVKWVERYNANIRDVDLFAGSEEFIASLRNDGLSCSILSAAIEKDIHDLLEHHGIAKYFRMVYGLDHGEAISKIERGREMLDALGLPSERVLLVGDTDHDYEVAKDLGIQVLILADGHQSYDRLARLPCKVLPTRYQD